MNRLILLPAFGAVLGIAVCSNALTISPGPFFTKATNAPLAGVLELSTDLPSRVSVSVDDGTRTWQRHFYDYGTTHRLPLLGFKPGRTNQITVTAHDQHRNAVTASQQLVFVTGPLPSDFPKTVLLKSEPERMEPGYTLFRVLFNSNNKAYVAVVDNSGEVVWYSGVSTTSDVRQLENGNLFIPLTTNFAEVNMLGETVHTWIVPANLRINLHDGVPTDHSTILYLNDASRTLTNFPTSATNPNAPLRTTNVLYNQVVEMSAATGALLHTWPLIDLLDPRRLTYLTFDSRTSLGWDIEHANAVLEDPRDDSLIVSMRNQNAVIKISRATGQLKWILGPHENWGPEFQRYLLTPVGTPFEWNYAQHAPTITPQGTLLLYDNGNARATPFNPPVPDTNNYSRAVEYDINEETMEVSQVWEYGSSIAETLFTDRVGNADWLPRTGNVLINFGYITYVNHVRPAPKAPRATMVRIQEVTHNPVPEVVFDLALFDYGNTNANYRGWYVYRSHRISDLYPHPVRPVADLTMSLEDRKAHLGFSADSSHAYVVEGSTDLVDWVELGAPEYRENGEFDFVDEIPGGELGYYRVVTREPPIPGG